VIAVLNLCRFGLRGSGGFGSSEGAPGLVAARSAELRRLRGAPVVEGFRKLGPIIVANDIKQLIMEGDGAAMEPAGEPQQERFVPDPTRKVTMNAVVNGRRP
jgi:hypothetical protein